MKPNQLLLMLSLLLLVACSSSGLGQTSEPGAMISPTSAVSANLPVTPTATPSPVPPTLTPTYTQTPKPAPTVTPTSTPSELALAEFCRIPAQTPPPRLSDTLYFRVSFQGWYRTTDRFVTSEWVAPYGYLSRDLQYLVTFDCQGAGTICVASPPTAHPDVLPVRHGLTNGQAAFDARWLSDNQRLVFWAGVLRSRSDLDARLYLLNVSTGRLVGITANMRYDYDVSPLGECVAYSAYEEDIKQFQFHVAALDNDQVRETWRAPVDESGKSVWPELDEPMTWSWDGRYVAFLKGEENNIRVWDLTTGEYQDYDACPRRPCSAYSLRWSPDGKSIYFHSGDAHWLMDLATGRAKKLLESRITGGQEFYRWLPDSQSLIVGEQSGSSWLWLDGRGELPLSYPGKSRTVLIDDLFW